MKAKLTLNIPKEIIDLSIMHLLDIFNGDATNINKSKIQEMIELFLARLSDDIDKKTLEIYSKDASIIARDLFREFDGSNKLRIEDIPW